MLWAETQLGVGSNLLLVNIGIMHSSHLGQRVLSNTLRALESCVSSLLRGGFTILLPYYWVENFEGRPSSGLT